MNQSSCPPGGGGGQALPAYSRWRQDAAAGRRGALRYSAAVFPAFSSDLSASGCGIEMTLYPEST